MTTTITTPGTYEGKTAEQWRQASTEQFRQQQDSFERCDTDGFLSQWATGLNAQECRLKAQLADNGGTMARTAVFDLDGNLLDAVSVEGAYGWSWMFLNADGRRDTTKGRNGFFSPSQAVKDTTRRANDAKKGFYVGAVSVPAVVDIRGGSITSVHAGIFPAEQAVTAATVIRVIDNGQ